MNWRRVFWLSGVCCAVIAFAAGYAGVPAYDIYLDTIDTEEKIRYLVENGENVASSPADEALSAEYLELIFGADEDLLAQVKKAVERGMKDTPDALDGQVSGILVTYRRNGDDKTENVVAHIVGEFPLGGRQISMHRDGFFADQVDPNLWSTGDAAIRFLGRDMIVWSNSEEDERIQREIIEAFFAGEVILLAEHILQKPVHFTMVLPAPQEILPSRMKAHVRAVLLNGFLTPQEGTMEVVLLADSERSAARLSTMAEDLKTSLQLIMRTRFHGVVVETAWGPHVPTWWALEMANTLDTVELERRNFTVNMSIDFERVMVNAVLKSIERFGRDYSQIRGVQEEKLDPRVVDARMQTRKPSHYWSEAHKWGPNWPFGSGTNIFIQGIEPKRDFQQAAPPVTEPL